jgi:fatty-acyl-CoA synthase
MKKVVSWPARRAVNEAVSAYLAVRSGLVAPQWPQQLLKMGAAFALHGGLGALPAVAAIRYPDRLAMIDERGSLTFGQLDARANALANSFRARGLRPGEGVAILARNHRGLLESVFAAAKCGAKIVLMNTDFAGPQLREVAAREGVDLLVYDEEYAETLTGVEPRRGRFRAWAETPGPDTIDALMTNASSGPPPRAGHAKIILLTSGTTGTPKGASRKEPRSLEPLGALLERVPFRAREVFELPAPMFHTLGFSMAMLAVAMGSTVVVRRKFDPAAVIESLHRNRATTMVAVPVMLQRIVDLDDSVFEGMDLSRLRIVFVAGSQLGAELCKRVTERLGPVVYNLYGSTEVAYATIATPADLDVEPGCVGRPVRGTTVRLYDDEGKPAKQGQPGRIFVGNSIQFEGYTGGGGKEIIDGLMSSGDVGHFDEAGRLFIDGRDDDMIVSGGENVFPGEVEELLASHHGVLEVSVIGVPDEKHGQRLAAFVVRRDGAELTEAEVKQHVSTNLARFKTPREVHFINELPRNPTGKVLKRELRELV